MLTYRQEVHIPIRGGEIPADLVIPGNASAIILFSHAGAGSRLNRLNKIVAEHLQQAGFGTLTPDLLSEDDVARTREFDIPLLAERLSAVAHWLQARDLFGHYRIGCYATTTGAAAALQTAANPDTPIAAIVCRGGRPDLVHDALPEIAPPTLLIVGSLDRYVLQLNREALEALPGEKKLSVVQGASHFFDNEKIAEVATLAVTWFQTHLGKATTSPGKRSMIEK